MTDAILITDATRPAVRLQRDLADPPAVVWQALTDRDQLRSWFPCDVIVAGGRWEPGAAISFPFDPAIAELTLAGEVLEVDEPRVLAFTWGEERLRFELTADGDGTRLVLVELTASPAARNAAGWDVCLDRLTGLEPPADAWRPRFAAYAAAFTPQLGPQDGPPPAFKGE
jgi:uncharacterized protein YndB with AHSA1/START domain